ncbi:unnamed protein product [Didymodactylos carnosus]|uniref:Mitotic-spindle organizing protein 1 n=1 Tax=Didymodactylos carnosus TaxID=1234261 RepID=A0A814GPB1_9BILA|nr:unnamed protein product [Didymodactylos carnosus]CAF0999305.1 unnamed protein product [Didymodactylos carnosus]CAF3611844.1 unnamed protein product [Didymodactylos carnosus]CAF3770776.1 unnamed protein product [Didymodactylos carnosus]
MKSDSSSETNEAREALECLNDLSQLLNTGLDKKTLTCCIRLLESGVHPDALAQIIQQSVNYNKTMRSSSLDYHRSSSLHHNNSGPSLHNSTGYDSYNHTSGGASDRQQFKDNYQNRYAWLEKNHVNEVGSTYNRLGKTVGHKPSFWRCEDQAIAGKEFQRLNDECADKIWDIRDKSDMSREWLLDADGVAPRFYQMEADAVR